jgi:hypothetical protein
MCALTKFSDVQSGALQFGFMIGTTNCSRVTALQTAILFGRVAALILSAGKIAASAAECAESCGSRSHPPSSVYRPAMPIEQAGWRRHPADQAGRLSLGL